MPLTFIDIERQKNWRIAVLFVVLILMYFVISLLLVYSFYEFFGLGGILYKGFPFPLERLAVIFLASFVIGSVHFYLSAYDTVRHIQRTIGAVDPDGDDEIHRRLMNIMEEIQVVTRNKVRIGCAVIPTLSMNALSAIDMRGNALIAITEGLLSRLSRAQTEAVMAHEAYHILSGDCLEGTVAASLFGLPSAIMEKVSAFSDRRAYLSPAFLLSVLLVKFGHLLNMFVSREREYRADAGAVRMTRNPLALAEVLHMLSRNWRGAGFIGNGFETLCIVNPKVSRRDEEEGWLADLLSTHPPIRKRIAILSRMARVRISDLGASARRSSVAAPSGASSEPLYYAVDKNYQWQGPFAFAELAALPWFSSLTWVSAGGETLEKASDIPLLGQIFRERLSGEGAEGNALCPHCHVPLLARSYEKTGIHQCRSCGGSMVRNARIPRVIARTSGGCSDRIRGLARTTLRANQLKRIARNARGAEKTVPLLSCPQCRRPMTRTFYSLAYLVEIDRCGVCGITWFDRDELRMLQCMIDGRMAADTGIPLD